MENLFKTRFLFTDINRKKFLPYFLTMKLELTLIAKNTPLYSAVIVY